jgi:hypothetical protein
MSLPEASMAFKTTDIAVGAYRAIPLNSLALCGAGTTTFTSDWKAGSTRIPSETPAALVISALLVARTEK